MAIISRQTGLLSAEDWKKVYQTFREADFTAYDFETLRKSMIDYIKINYAEDFNDFTESSEFIALIDLIAFLGQSLAFRTDLNARENFIDTAERRDSILKLARLIGYNPKRAIPATGYLKVDSVSTTENIYDSDGIDLSNVVINWDDSANENWLEQFTAVINSSLVNTQVVGRPGNTQTINGIRTEEYSINVVTNIVPVYRFEATVDRQRMPFEIVSATSMNKSYVYEAAPNYNKVLNFLYRNDNTGNSSNDTGFFLYFKQGELGSTDFNIDEMLPNKIVNIDISNINNTDIWLYGVDSTGTAQSLWTQVPATSGINVIYNQQSERNLYQVNSRANDQISLIFGDGSFANIPQGNFRLYYRISNGLTYRITSDEMRGVIINVNYVSRTNRIETLTFRASLRYTVANANTRESVDDIKQRAPQQYYTQNRMITGEDYNILPYTNYSTIVKVKAINRTSAGLSRYLDVLDTTGKYSSTNIFGSDGVLYREPFIKSQQFSVGTRAEILKLINNSIVPDILKSRELLHFYYDSVVAKSSPSYTVPAALLKNNETYTIEFTGNTNFLVYGAKSNTIGTTFVASDAGNYNRNYRVSALNNNSGYVFAGSATGTNSNIYVRSGDILTFEVNTAGHPFWIKTVSSTGTGNAVTTGTISNNGISTGTIIWNTAGVDPGNYYYNCQVHSAMKGNIIVSGFGTGLAVTNLVWILGSIGDSNVTGYFSYNQSPVPVGQLSITKSKYITPGSLLIFGAPTGYFFNATNNIVQGLPLKSDESQFIYAAVMQIIGDGTNNYRGLYSNGTGPVTLNIKVPTGAQLKFIVPRFQNNLNDYTIGLIASKIASYQNFAIYYDIDDQDWKLIDSEQLSASSDTWLLTFNWSNVDLVYTLTYKGLNYIFHSPNETNFFFDESQKIYDSYNNTIIEDSIKILSINTRPDSNFPLTKDYQWKIYKNIISSDGYTDNKRILLTYADTNNDSVPDYPNLFTNIVDPTVNPLNKLIFFKLVVGYDKFITLELVESRKIITRFEREPEINQVIRNFDVGQLFYLPTTNQFKQVELVSGLKILSANLENYIAYVGRQNLYYQYRHNSPNTNRIDPGITNIIDLYVLTKEFNTAYRQWLQDTSNRLVEPLPPTSLELSVSYGQLNDYKAMSDSLIFNSAVFKPLFGSKARSVFRAIFKVVKNPNVSVSDADIKVSVISAINVYFSEENWDFGETFYFSELSAYLHRALSPKIASIVIVPRDASISFGNLFQINAEANEIILSAATVDDVEIINAVTIGQLNQSLLSSNQSA